MVSRAVVLAWLGWNASGFFEWLANRPWYRQVLTDWVAAIPVEAGQQGLEVGAGPGTLTRHAHERGLVMTGLDRSATMVKRARRSAPECTFVEGDALDLPIDRHSVDVGFAASVVNVVKQPKTLVSELARVVRPGGRVSVLFPTPRLAEHAIEVGARRRLRGLSNAALQIWGAKAPMCEPEAIVAVFREVGLQEIRVDLFLDGTVASVTGRVA